MYGIFTCIYHKNLCHTWMVWDKKYIEIRLLSQCYFCRLAYFLTFKLTQGFKLFRRGKASEWLWVVRKLFWNHTGKPHQASTKLNSWIFESSVRRLFVMTPNKPPKRYTLRRLSPKEMDVSKNSGTPKSSILIGFSIINHPFGGSPIFRHTQMDKDFLAGSSDNNGEHLEAMKIHGSCFLYLSHTTELRWFRRIIAKLQLVFFTLLGKNLSEDWWEDFQQRDWPWYVYVQDVFFECS